VYGEGRDQRRALKKVVKAQNKKEIVNYLIEEHSLSVRSACRISHFSRSLYYYEPKKVDDEEVLVAALQKLADQHPRYGFWKMYYTLRNRGHHWNHKKVYRVYKLLKLNLKRKYKRRLPKREKEPLEVPKRLNEAWSMDFMSDQLTHGRRFRTLNIMDDYNRELCWIEIDLSLPSARVINVLKNVIEQRGRPQKIRVDNGPEFISEVFTSFCEKQGIKVQFIQPGKPMQNGFIERFNRSYRTEVLDAYLFRTIQEVKDQTYFWAEEYNTIRPHESLNNLPPIMFAQLALAN